MTLYGRDWFMEQIVSFTSQDLAAVVYALVFHAGVLAGWAVIAGFKSRF